MENYSSGLCSGATCADNIGGSMEEDNKTIPARKPTCVMMVLVIFLVFWFWLSVFSLAVLSVAVMLWPYHLKWINQIISTSNQQEKLF